MKTKRSLTGPGPEVDIELPQRRGLFGAWERFWFTASDPTGLHWVRVLSGILFLVWLGSFAGRQQDYLGLRGWFDLRALNEARAPDPMLQEQIGTPIARWSLLYIATSPAMLDVLYWGALAILALFTLGVWTRVTSILTWLIVVSFVWNPAIGHDADFLLGILAFYLMVAYVCLGQWSRPQTIFGRILGNADTILGAALIFPDGARERFSSSAANVVLRLLQVHFAIIVVTSGFHKLQFGEYWGGVALWFPLHDPMTVTHQILREELRALQTVPILIAILPMLPLAWWLGGQAVSAERKTVLRVSLMLIPLALAVWWFEKRDAFGNRTVELFPNIPTTAETVFNLLLLSVAVYATLAWQLTFPFFAWRKRTRWLLLGGAAVGWLACAFIYKLPMFGPVYAVFCLSYLTTGEWQWLSSLGGRIVNRVAPASVQAPAERTPITRAQRLVAP